jgi:ATP-dependent RNA helicase SUPV3L1/SUV3
VLKALGFWLDRRQLAVTAVESANTPTIAGCVPPAPDTSSVQAQQGSPAEDLPGADPQTQPPAFSASAPEPAPTTVVAEPKWEEIWRPRRRGRPLPRPARPARPAQAHVAERQQYQPRPASMRETEGDRQSEKARPERRDRRREGYRDGGGKSRREERPRAQLQAPPASAKSGFDPDSPFAALSSLKAAMDKRTQE